MACNWENRAMESTAEATISCKITLNYNTPHSNIHILLYLFYVQLTLREKKHPDPPFLSHISHREYIKQLKTLPKRICIKNWRIILTYFLCGIETKIRYEFCTSPFPRWTLYSGERTLSTKTDTYYVWAGFKILKYKIWKKEENVGPNSTAVVMKSGARQNGLFSREVSSKSSALPPTSLIRVPWSSTLPLPHRQVGYLEKLYKIVRAVIIQVDYSKRPREDDAVCRSEPTPRHTWVRSGDDSGGVQHRNGDGFRTVVGAYRLEIEKIRRVKHW